LIRIGLGRRKDRHDGTMIDRTIHKELWKTELFKMRPHGSNLGLDRITQVGTRIYDGVGEGGQYDRTYSVEKFAKTEIELGWNYRNYGITVE
jgi:hypothetical protein